MSVDSALIVRKTALPTAERLTADIAETGVTVTFPADFALDRNLGGWVPVTVAVTGLQQSPTGLQRL